MLFDSLMRSAISPECWRSNYLVTSAQLFYIFIYYLEYSLCKFPSAEQRFSFQILYTLALSGKDSLDDLGIGSADVSHENEPTQLPTRP